MVPSASGEEQKSTLGVNHFSVDRSAGLAGQYQVAYNPEENVLFVSGSLITRRPTVLSAQQSHA